MSNVSPNVRIAKAEKPCSELKTDILSSSDGGRGEKVATRRRRSVCGHRKLREDISEGAETCWWSLAARSLLV